MKLNERGKNSIIPCNFDRYFHRFFFFLFVKIRLSSIRTYRFKIDFYLDYKFSVSRNIGNVIKPFSFQLYLIPYQ